MYPYLGPTYVWRGHGGVGWLRVPASFFKRICCWRGQGGRTEGAPIFKSARPTHDAAQSLFEPAHVDHLSLFRLLAVCATSKVACTVHQFEANFHHRVPSRRTSLRSVPGYVAFILKYMPAEVAVQALPVW